MSNSEKKKGFSTVCVHTDMKDGNQSHLNPIYASSTYFFKSEEDAIDLLEGRRQGYIYARYGSPNTLEVERKLADLETHGLNIKAVSILHSSGMGALSTLFLSNLRSGDRLITCFPQYGGTQALLTEILQHTGIEIIECDLLDLSKLEKLLQKKESKNIKWIHCETPNNPMNTMYDVAEICKLAKKYKVQTSFDTTFATPYLLQPFKYGADYIIHSTTKFLNGHGTATGGVLISTNIDYMNEHCLKWQRILGSNPSAFDAFLLNVGLKTLEIRMDRICFNAQKIAEFLEDHPKVSKVFYPGLKSNSTHEIAKKYMKAYGGVISFYIKGGYESAKLFYNHLKICTRAVSLGNVDTLVCHPASSTHYIVDKDTREAQGVTDELLRISVGIEDIHDLIKDLGQALDHATSSKL